MVYTFVSDHLDPVLRSGYYSECVEQDFAAYIMIWEVQEANAANVFFFSRCQEWSLSAESVVIMGCHPPDRLPEP